MCPVYSLLQNGVDLQRDLQLPFVLNGLLLKTKAGPQLVPMLYDVMQDVLDALAGQPPIRSLSS